MREDKSAPASADPFDIPLAEIPKGKTYQWITQSVMGNVFFDQTPDFVRAGWKRVPLARHKKRFTKSGDKKYIEIDGLVLMEKSTKQVQRSRKKDRDAAAALAAMASFKDSEKYSATVGGNGPVSIDYAWARSVNGKGFDAQFERFKRRWICRIFGLTYGQLEAANDGTLVWNTTEKIGKVLGTVELIRRVRALRKSGELPRRMFLWKVPNH